MVDLEKRTFRYSKDGRSYKLEISLQNKYLPRSTVKVIIYHGNTTLHAITFPWDKRQHYLQFFEEQVRTYIIKGMDELKKGINLKIEDNGKVETSGQRLYLPDVYHICQCGEKVNCTPNSDGVMDEYDLNSNFTWHLGRCDECGKEFEGSATYRLKASITLEVVD